MSTLTQLTSTVRLGMKSAREVGVLRRKDVPMQTLFCLIAEVLSFDKVLQSHAEQAAALFGG